MVWSESHTREIKKVGFITQLSNFPDIFIIFIKLTFGIKLDGVTVELSEAPWAVEDRSSLCDVGLRCVGLRSSYQHTCTVNERQTERKLAINLLVYTSQTTRSL